MTDTIEGEEDKANITMADTEKQEQVDSKPQTMADTEEQPQPQQPQTNKAEKMTNLSSFSFSIWPPTQRTRDAVINRLIETLSSPSVLSKRYGCLPSDEASKAAHSIEDEAFAAASASASSYDDGIEILQVYSKEISKRMLDAVKARSSSASPAVVPTPTATEQISTVDNNGDES